MLFLGQRKCFRVEGDSMAPLLQPGDEILVKKTRYFKVGDVLLSRHPIQSDLVIVKRIEFINSDGLLKLAGLNPKSSHHFGLIKSELVYGKVVSLLRT